MGAFNINITGVGGHGCERKAKPGEKLYGRFVDDMLKNERKSGQF